MEVYPELIAEWKAEKLDVTSLFARCPYLSLPGLRWRRMARSLTWSPSGSLRLHSPSQAGEH